jgi:hypothetical protein
MCTVAGRIGHGTARKNHGRDGGDYFYLHVDIPDLFG